MDKVIQEPAKILTEEELQKIELDFSLSTSSAAFVMFRVIDSHRLLLSANAELSFQNMLLKAAYDKLLKENNSCTTQ
jgi:hypothetical protein